MNWIVALLDPLHCVHAMNAPLQSSSFRDIDNTSALEALRVLAARPELSQRELSQALGLSLGKTHYVLHALLDKGFVKMQNFRRSDNKLAYAYLLTPKGAREKLRMTQRFLARMEAEFEVLQAKIVELRREVTTVQGAGAPDRVRS